MFLPRTEKIKGLLEKHPSVIRELERLLSSETNVYIDYANVRPWSTKLKWNIDIKRLKQFLDSFDTVRAIHFYNGYIEGDEDSKREIQQAEKERYIVRKKPVKILKLGIDASSVPSDSTHLLNKFIRRSLLRKYEIETIEYLNHRFKYMNEKGSFYIEDRKCNFDVEIGIDMLLDFEHNAAKTYILWSGDSDFAYPVEKLLKAKRRVILFATARRVSRELSDLRSAGLLIFDIKKIRDFICWNRDLKKQKGLQ